MSLKEYSKEILFILFFALGLLIVHELGHCLWYTIHPDMYFKEFLVFPEVLTIQCVARQRVLADEFPIAIGNILFPFLIQIIYLLFFRKKLSSSKEFFLWFFIGIIYLQHDVRFLKELM